VGVDVFVIVVVDAVAAVVDVDLVDVAVGVGVGTVAVISSYAIVSYRLGENKESCNRKTPSERLGFDLFVGSRKAQLSSALSRLVQLDRIACNSRRQVSRMYSSLV
jgi:hypothetical protein